MFLVAFHIDLDQINPLDAVRRQVVIAPRDFQIRRAGRAVLIAVQEIARSLVLGRRFEELERLVSRAQADRLYEDVS
jgi:hypothetical protein